MLTHEREANHILRTWENNPDKNHHLLHAYRTLSTLVSMFEAQFVSSSHFSLQDSLLPNHLEMDSTEWISKWL